MTPLTQAEIAQIADAATPWDEIEPLAQAADDKQAFDALVDRVLLERPYLARMQAIEILVGLRDESDLI